MLSWYNEAGYLAKGGQPAAMVNLPDVVRYATTRLLRGQAIVAAAGAVIFLVLGLAVGSRSGRRTGAHPPPPAPL
jgi:hypothetical protein